MEKCMPEVIQYMDYMPTGYGPEIEKYAIDEVFQDSRYIFTWREKVRQIDPLLFSMRVVNQQYGYCTHCNNQFQTSELRHNTETQCPVCHSKCIAKDSGRSRQGLTAKAYFVFYEKTHLNPQAMIARGIWAVRDYTGDFRKVVTKYQTDALYIFEPGHSAMLALCWGWREYKWGLCAKVYSQFALSIKTDTGSCSGVIYKCARSSIAEAVKGTSFQYSTWESYNMQDMVKFFALYNKYPCIEYLTKLGFSGLVEAKLSNKGMCGGVINWRGKTPEKILRLPRKHILDIKFFRAASNAKIDPTFLKLMQISVKDGSNLPPAEIMKLRELQGYYLTSLEEILKYASIKKVYPYVEKQFLLAQKEHRENPFYSLSGVLTHWKDYIADCIALLMNLDDDRILYPKDLFAAHQDTIKRVKTEGNKLMDMAIQKRLPELDRYCFEYNGFLIRPAKSTGELIKEGKALTICIGNYINGYMTKYSKGEIVLLLIRKASKPNKPLYAMEVRDNKIIQTQGENHCLPGKDVQAFIDAFKAECLTSKKRVRVSVPA